MNRNKAGTAPSDAWLATPLPRGSLPNSLGFVYFSEKQHGAKAVKDDSRWFIFGRYENGNVDISDGEKDVVTNISEDQAKLIIAKINTLETNLNERSYQLIEALRSQSSGEANG